MEPTPRNRPPLPLDVRGFVATRPGGFRLRVDALTVAPGEAVVVAGPSGSGKSTLLGALVAHPAAGDPLTWTGAVDVLGAPWPARGSPAWRDALRGPVCVVPQDAQRALDPLRRLGAQVGALAGEGRDAVDAALARLGIELRSGVSLF